MKYVLRADDRLGPQVNGSKAAAILAAGGRIYALQLDDKDQPEWGIEARAEARHRYTMFRTGDPEYRVNWSSASTSTPEQAQAHAHVVHAVSRVAIEARSLGDPFGSVPPWVKRQLRDLDWEEESFTAEAARRYCAGDANTTEAWNWAVDKIIEKGKVPS